MKNKHQALFMKENEDPTAMIKNYNPFRAFTILNLT